MRKCDGVQSSHTRFLKSLFHICHIVPCAVQLALLERYGIDDRDICAGFSETACCNLKYSLFIDFFILSKV
jgi:hypothetical protein